MKLELKYYQPHPVYQHGDSTKIAFVPIQKAYLRAKEITTFPDGGQSKVIYIKTGLYIFDLGKKKYEIYSEKTYKSIQALL